MKGSWYYIKPLNTTRKLSYLLLTKKIKWNLKIQLSHKMSREIIIWVVLRSFLTWISYSWSAMSITYQTSKFDSKFKKTNFSLLRGITAKNFFFEKIVFVLCKKLTSQFCSEFNADPHHVDFFLKNIGEWKMTVLPLIIWGLIIYIFQKLLQLGQFKSGSRENLYIFFSRLVH